MSLFESYLTVAKEETDFWLRQVKEIGWSDFWLNPRKLRGSDFLMRWSQGVWSEKRILEVINRTEDFFAIPYGPSGVAPTDDVRAFELYFERLEAAGLSRLKRPDLLFFTRQEKAFVDDFVQRLGGVDELPFTPEINLQPLITKAKIAIECENSLWVAEKMPAFDKPLKPQKRLDGKLGLSKTAVLPTVIIKEEDRQPLLLWQAENQVPVHIWHVFFDRAYGLALDEAERLLAEGLILPIEQVFQSPNGATTTKAIYKFYYHYAYLLGVAVESPTLIPDFVQDKNGHILPFVRFAGGKLELSQSAWKVLRNL
jgi:hypothetical protein